jgi:hypothetical protein
MLRLILIFACLIPLSATAVEFASGQEKTTVVELYTSEGCSSCPPADKWLSSLKSDARLFKTLLPIAYHVDYWDNLGWADPYASEAYSQRQRDLVKMGILSQVYTPGIVVNSQEWRGWFKSSRQLSTAANRVGQLRADFDKRMLTVDFSTDGQYTAHVAILGMGISTDVAAGENRGRKLKHDFVVLDSWQKPGQSEWQFDLADIPDKGQQKTALAVWLTAPGSMSVVQATGGYLD